MESYAIFIRMPRGLPRGGFTVHAHREEVCTIDKSGNLY